MADLDLLVSPIEEAEAIKLIEELGFRKTHVTWKHAVFEPQQKAPPASFGESARNALKIELHTHIGEQLRCIRSSSTPLCFRASRGLDSTTTARAQP